MYQLYRDGEFENVLFETMTRAVAVADNLVSLRSCWKIDVIDITTGEVVYERGA